MYRVKTTYRSEGSTNKTWMYCVKDDMSAEMTADRRVMKIELKDKLPNPNNGKRTSG